MPKGNSMNGMKRNKKSELEEFCMNCPCFTMKFDKLSWSDGSNGFYVGNMFASCQRTNGWVDESLCVHAYIDKDDFKDGNDVLGYGVLLFKDFVPRSLKGQYQNYLKQYPCPLESNNRNCMFYTERRLGEWNRQAKKKA